MLKVIGYILIGSVAVFFALAGIAKLTELDEFTRSLDSWTAIPEWTHTIVAIVVPSAELVAGVGLLLGVSKRWSVWMMAAMLVVFTGLYLYQVVVGEPPDCNCLGKLTEFARERQLATNVVVRNSVLLLGLAVGVSLINIARRKSP